MNKAREKFIGKSLEEIADFMADGQPGSPNAHRGYTEFLLRSTEAQIESAKSQKYSVWIMLGSVIVLALSSLANLIFKMLD